MVALAGQKLAVKEEIDRITHQLHDHDAEERDIAKILTTDYYAYDESEIGYILEQFFTRPEEEGGEPVAPDPDRSYIKTMAPLFRKYEPIVRKLVDTHTISFGFDQMDTLDRVVFVLGYAEYQELKTPRQVILNEMIELAKRYGDESSSKLINGIAHKMFTVDDKMIKGEIVKEKNEEGGKVEGGKQTDVGTHGNASEDGEIKKAKPVKEKKEVKVKIKKEPTKKTKKKTSK